MSYQFCKADFYLNEVITKEIKIHDEKLYTWINIFRPK